MYIFGFVFFNYFFNELLSVLSDALNIVISYTDENKSK